MTVRSFPLSTALGTGAVAETEALDGLRGTGLGYVEPLRFVAAASVLRTQRRSGHVVTWFGDAAGALTTCLLVAWAEPWLGRSSTSISQRASFAGIALAVLLVALTIHATRSGAGRRIVPSVADDLGPLLAVLAGAGVVLLALHSVQWFGAATPVPEVGLMVATAAVVVPTGRAAALFAFALSPDAPRRTLIVGSGPVAEQLARRLGRSPFVEVVWSEQGSSRRRAPMLESFDTLARVVATERIDTVLVTGLGEDADGALDVLQQLRGTVDIDIVCCGHQLSGWSTRLSDVTGLTLLCVGRSPSAPARAAKRAVDVVVAATALVLLAPLLAATAIAIRLDSPGPALFRQSRVGRDRRMFTIFKFRTMQTSGSTPGAQRLVAIDDVLPSRRTPLDAVADPRFVTRVGSFLRRSGLDELPQLYNVLRGDMSLVGPRPFVPDECGGIDGWRRRRFEVRPGMTGMWQVCGQHDVTMDDLCRLDVEYATSWSLASDVRILARTPKRLLTGSRPG